MNGDAKSKRAKYAGQGWLGLCTSFAWEALRAPIRLLLLPWKLFVKLKRSLTSASVTLMLMAFMSLNIVWGYPWSGMLAACLACLIIGWAANWLTRAKIDAGCSLPASVPVGQPVRVVSHLVNTNRLPALDTLVSFEANPQIGKRRRVSVDENDVVASRPAFYALMRSGERIEFESQLSFGRRGVHHLPPLLIQSTFPFYLFRWQKLVFLGAEIAVTPVPLDEENHHAAKRVLSAVGVWARRLLAGDASEYVGSREYQSGMSVRRWDFASWARLGRPIVREFQSPSVRSMNLIIDTAAMNESETGSGEDDAFEYLMSMTVSVLNLFSGNSVSVQMFLTDETLDGPLQGDTHQGSGLGERSAAANPFLNDWDTQLIRLAKSKQVASDVADHRIEAITGQLGRDPTLLLSRRPVDQFDSLAGEVSVFNVRFGDKGTDDRPAVAGETNLVGSA
jgi:uncharacterized protein (DUF58 family)